MINGKLVGGIPAPLKNDGVRQLGWWHSQLNGKIIQMFQTTNQYWHNMGLAEKKKRQKPIHFAHQENHLWKGKYGNMRINPTCLGLFQACQSLSSSSSHLASAQIHQNEVGLVRPVLQTFPGEEAWPGLFVHPKTNRDEPLSKHKSGEQPRSTESAILHLTHVAMTAEQLRQQPWERARRCPSNRDSTKASNN